MWKRWNSVIWRVVIAILTLLVTMHYLTITAC